MAQWKSTSKKRRKAAGKAGTATTGASAPVRRDAAGRLHLLLHRDPSGQHHVRLAAPLFQERWQNEVALSAANGALSALQGGVEERAVINLARSAMDATSQLAEGFLARAEQGAVACKAGCDHCCYQSVGVTTAEALTIVDHLRETRSEEQLELLAQYLRVARGRTRALTADQRYAPEFPCPFLIEAQCSIYPVRPLSCRGMNALDAAECRSYLRDPDARAAFLESGVGVRSFMEPIRAFHAVSAGLQLGLSELYGLDMRPLDLTAALHELLSGPTSVVSEWLAGESPLESARGGDSTADVATQRASGVLTR